MKIQNGIEMLEISGNLANGPGLISPVIIEDKGQLMLVDTGLPGMLQQIRKEVEKTGLDFNKLNKVIITHSDLDHIGSLAAIVSESLLRVKVISHELEKPYIQCEQEPIRLKQIEVQLKFLKGETYTQLKALHDSLKQNYKIFKANVDETISDGEELPFCGGIIVIHTPGHTLGHVSLYIKRYKILIAGDVMNVENKVLVKGPNFTLIDKTLAEESLKKLTRYDIETVICYHGGLYNYEANNRIAELSNT